MLKIISKTKNKIFYYLNQLIKRTQWYQGLFVDFKHLRYPDTFWYRAHYERNYDLINLGSSIGFWAFDYEKMNVKAMNWANQPQALVCDLQLIKNFHSILKKGGKVLIVLSPGSGFNKHVNHMDTLKYIGTLDWSLLDPHFREQASHLYYSPIAFGRPAIHALARYILKKENYQNIPAGAMDDSNHMSESELLYDAKCIFKGWQKQFAIDDLSYPFTIENQAGRFYRILVMQEMIDFILERDYEPVIVIPPVSEYFHKVMPKNFMDNFVYSFINAIKRNVKILDYSNEIVFQDASLYFNSFLLNRKGRHVFTKRVLSDLDVHCNAL